MKTAARMRRMTTTPATVDPAMTAVRLIFVEFEFEGVDSEGRGDTTVVTCPLGAVVTIVVKEVLAVVAEGVSELGVDCLVVV